MMMRAELADGPLPRAARAGRSRAFRRPLRAPAPARPAGGSRRGESAGTGRADRSRRPRSRPRSPAESPARNPSSPRRRSSGKRWRSSSSVTRAGATDPKNPSQARASRLRQYHPLCPGGQGRFARSMYTCAQKGSRVSPGGSATAHPGIASVLQGATGRGRRFGAGVSPSKIW